MPKKLSVISKPVLMQKIYNILRYRTNEESALSLTEIANLMAKDGHDISYKSVERYIEEMSDSHGLCVAENTYPKKFFRSEDFEPDYQLTFQEWELKTMALALNSLKEMSDPHQRILCEKTEAILMAKFPKEVAKDFERLKSYVVVTPAFRTQTGVEYSKTYAEVLKSLKMGRLISCQNHSPYKPKADNKKTRKFSPLKIHMVGSEHYLMAFDHEDKNIKRLKICRLQGVKILEQKVDKKLEKDVEDMKLTIGGYGGPDVPVWQYEIHCDEVMATLFQEKRLHSTQVVEEKDGNWIIRFESHPSIEVSRYLAGWAKHINHIEPPAAFDEMKEIWNAGANLVSLKKAA
jgi:predicted DNA-binding transcriptional regulator YafY